MEEIQREVDELAAHGVISKPTVSVKDCGAHEYEELTDDGDYIGTYCKKCGIEMGIECFHPECRKTLQECDKHTVTGKVFSTENYGNIADKMTDDTYCIFLGHDGVGCNCEMDIEGLRRMLSFKGLRRVSYCGYYSPGYFYDIIEEAQYSHIEFVAYY